MALLGVAPRLCPFCPPTSTFLLCPTDQKEEVIERRGCLPRAHCPLLGRATYWSQPYALRHQCCEQDLCNAAASLPGLPRLPLTTLSLPAAIFAWGVHIFL